MLRKIYFYGSIAFVYALTIGAVGMILYPSYSAEIQTRVAAKNNVAIHVPAAPIALTKPIIQGLPVRITIPSAGIDLAVDEGFYNEATRAWTLSPIHAEYAASTMKANDLGGATFIYGHGTDAVLGNLDTNPPAVGSIATVYTENGHTFTYVLKDIHDFKPTDTSILKDASSGPPRLIVQTCKGALSEWRAIFTYVLRKAT